MSTAPFTTTASEVDRQWAANTLAKAFHDEFCEYDGMEDGAAVCPGECRELAEAITGKAPGLEDES